jgi:hypothetical protein
MKSKILFIGFLSGDCFRDYLDYKLFSRWWLETDCGDCGGVYLTGDSSLMLDDLADFAGAWLFQS